MCHTVLQIFLAATLNMSTSIIVLADTKMAQRRIKSTRWLKSFLTTQIDIPTEQLPLVQGGVEYWVTLNNWGEKKLSPPVWRFVQTAWEQKRLQARKKAAKCLLSTSRQTLIQAVEARPDSHHTCLEGLILKNGLAALDEKEGKRILNEISSGQG
ncbi:hypothetical protein DJ031_07500 [bacterium endosymbiont of Escarpia laminata]|nr:MAG: hypothetical protein DJ031_07500 [bacterium endosymbiont of Escarpia laminata]